jgi:lipopolysaccharide/colanic/teichoic acid biosynthesis glycosyltransferase
MIRAFDILFSLFGLVLLSPVFLIVSVWIYLDTKGPIFYKQLRVGKGGIDFYLFKFRSMNIKSDTSSLITVGNRDSRITNSGYNIRKFKLDELPQLINVLKGDMSLVGPRPEVRKYVDYYNEEQKVILSVKPGITDFASIRFVSENELLAKSLDPEKTYIDEIMPLKIELNKIFINSPTLKNYFKIILTTIKGIF